MSKSHLRTQMLSNSKISYGTLNSVMGTDVCLTGVNASNIINTFFINKFSTNKMHNRIHLSTYGGELQHVLAIPYSYPQAVLTYKGYTGCNRRNGPDFGSVFLRSNYTDITQNTYIQSWMVTEILAREKNGLLWCLRTVLISVMSFSPLLELHSYVRANVAPVTLAMGGVFSSV